MEIKALEGEASEIDGNEAEGPNNYELYENLPNKHLFEETDSVDTISTVTQIKMEPETMTNNIKLKTNIDIDFQVKDLIEKGEGVWKCKMCEKSLKNNGHIIEHVETHIEGLSYVCDMCGKTLSTRSSLRTHRRKFHVS